MVDAKIIMVEIGLISYSEARVIPIRQHTALRFPSSVGRIIIIAVVQGNCDAHDARIIFVQRSSNTQSARVNC